MIRRTRRRKWLAGLVILVMGLSVYFGTSRWQADLNVPRLDGSTMTIVPGIHLLGGLGPAAAYAVETSEGLVLIDSGLDDDAGRLKAEIGKLGLDWKNLRAIFLTHVHGDHCGGAERLRAETGARVYAGQGDSPLLIAGEPREAFFSTFRMPDHSPHPTTIDVPLLGNESITIGAVRFQILDTPGHTAGSTCYLVECSGLRVLFAGDVILRLGDKPFGTYSTYLAPRYGGDARTYLDSLRKLQALPLPDLVLPGHPNASRPPQSPRITQTQWDEMFDDGILEMERLVARYQSDGASFLDGKPRRLLPDLYYLGDFQGAAVYGLFAGQELFLVDAPGGPGLIDFVKNRLRDLGLPPTEPRAVLMTACGEKETAGLKDLIERTRVQVVASPVGIETIKNLCPPGTSVMSTAELPQQHWFNVSAIPLSGRGVAPVAYLLRWADKNVLLTGRIPIHVDPQSQEELSTEWGTSRQNAIDYIGSIRQLANLQPALWLPAIPVDGQNANLYDAAWPAILEKNYRAANEFLNTIPPRAVVRP